MKTAGLDQVVQANLNPQRHGIAVPGCDLATATAGTMITDAK